MTDSIAYMQRHPHTLADGSPEGIFHRLLHTHNVLETLTCTRDTKTRKRVFSGQVVVFELKYLKYNVLSDNIVHAVYQG